MTMKRRRGLAFTSGFATDFFFLCLSLSFSLEFPANTWAHCQEHVVSFSLFNPPPCHHYQQAHYQGLTADSKQHPPTSILKSWCCMHTQIHTSCTYNCLHVMWSQILFRDDTAELDMILGSGGGWAVSGITSTLPNSHHIQFEACSTALAGVLSLSSYKRGKPLLSVGGSKNHI